MKTAMRHILCMFFLFSLTFSLYGRQETEPKPDNDGRLTRYELLCKECLELKDLVAEGKQISRAYASDKIAGFVAMNREIKAASDSLTPLQVSRFEMINRWFSTGKRPMALDHVLMTGDLPEMTGQAVCMTSRQKEVSIKILSAPSEPRTDEYFNDTQTRQHGGIEDKIIDTYIMAGFSLPVSYGLMIGLKESGNSGQKGLLWGGYMHFRSNFRFTETAYSCLGNGKLDNGLSFWGTGNSQRNNLAATVGVLAGPLRWMDIYAGAGYGQSSLIWEDIDGSWACVSDFTHKGLALEAGLITSWRSLCLGIGISTINFRTASLDLSVGVRF